MMIEDFAISPDRTGHDPNWDPGVVGRVRLVRAGLCGRVRGLNVSRKKRPGGAIILIFMLQKMLRDYPR